jgi:cell division protein FtsB
MKKMKRTLLRIFFALEIVACAFFYVFGANGLQTMRYMKQENMKVAQRIAQEQQAIKQLELQIALWQTHDFYKEKKAREQLQMAHTDDIVYYLDN